MRYHKYATAVVGAHSVLDWYEALDRLVAIGQLLMASTADAVGKPFSFQQMAAKVRPRLDAAD